MWEVVKPDDGTGFVVVDKFENIEEAVGSYSSNDFEKEPILFLRCDPAPDQTEKELIEQILSVNEGRVRRIMHGVRIVSEKADQLAVACPGKCFCVHEYGKTSRCESHREHCGRTIFYDCGLNC